MVIIYIKSSLADIIVQASSYWNTVYVVKLTHTKILKSLFPTMNDLVDYITFWLHLLSQSTKYQILWIPRHLVKYSHKRTYYLWSFLSPIDSKIYREELSGKRKLTRLRFADAVNLVEKKKIAFNFSPSMLGDIGSCCYVKSQWSE